MKEDILEQVVEDYLQFQGYFTIHNVPFHPDRGHPDFCAKEDSVPSDIDVIGINPRKRGTERVIAVTCKSWQGGFHAERLLAQLRGERPNPRRERWRQFRELWVPKWSAAFRQQIEERTGATRFAYRIAVTQLKGDACGWHSEKRIAENLPDCSFGFLEMGEMWKEILAELTQRPAASELGRLAQLLKAAKVTPD